MNQRINLLQNRASILALQHRYAYLRTATYVYVGIFLMFCLVAGIYLYSLSSQLQAAEAQKDELLRSMEGTQEQEVKLSLLGRKVRQFDAFIQEDAHITPYYNILLETLQQSSQSATLSEFSINKEREATFTIKFLTFDDLLESFRFIESPAFLANFEKLSMNNFSSQSTSENNSSSNAEEDVYQLTFEATFKFISPYGSN